MCDQVMNAHIERNDTESFMNMCYIVKHSNKQAIFKLKSLNDTFGEIKINIAEYFGLP